MFGEDWELPFLDSQRRQCRRVPLMRVIRYHASDAYESYDGSDCTDEEIIESRDGEALSINIGSGGMLLMMDWDPDLNRILKLDVPTPVNLARTPTLAQVRWKRKSPYRESDPLYFVGMKFVL